MMTCQHTTFAPVDSPASFSGAGNGFPAILFQPILDTFAHRVLAHECVVSTIEPARNARINALAIQSAAAQNAEGRYLFRLTPSGTGDPEYDLQPAASAGLPVANMVFDIAECDLAGYEGHSLFIRDYLRKRGFPFSLSGTGVTPGLESILKYAPDYIRIHRRLIRSIDRPASAATVSKLVRIAERSGAPLIAEGVDRVRTVESLWLLGVQFMQGDLFGRPSANVL
jgi:EAL domain-containing protein (putative c-di-GMP-specific phosphodiesterase class I)